MTSDQPFFLFYEEPDPDRFFRGDRYPRRLIRRLLRGRPQPGGVMRWFLNLKAGLDELGFLYRLNDYAGLRRAPGSWAHVVGKSHVIRQIPAGHPIIYGPGISSHPVENDFWGEADIRLLLISCDWFRAMYDRDLPTRIPTVVWPAGVDTDLWQPSRRRDCRAILIYDKIRWHREELVPRLLDPIRRHVVAYGLAPHYLRYGAYREDEYRALLGQVRAMIFLCEHETQGFAYLQALASGVPVFAWDRGGLWQDPNLYPHRVQFGPVTSVPYFDTRCGERFTDLAEFERRFPAFWAAVQQAAFHPRDYVAANFNLRQRAQEYLQHCRNAQFTAFSP